MRNVDKAYQVWRLLHNSDTWFPNGNQPSVCMYSVSKHVFEHVEIEGKPVIFENVCLDKWTQNKFLQVHISFIFMSIYIRYRMTEVYTCDLQ